MLVEGLPDQRLDNRLAAHIEFLSGFIEFLWLTARTWQKGRTLHGTDRRPAINSKPAPTPDAGPPNMDAPMALAEHQFAQRYRESGLNSFWNPPAAPKQTPRNA
jgi:hypothetical protein